MQYKKVVVVCVDGCASLKRLQVMPTRQMISAYEKDCEFY